MEKVQRARLARTAPACLLQRIDAGAGPLAEFFYGRTAKLTAGRFII